jgi:ADP-ribose pyrophosphatase YjhB (NUDIX family)
MSVGGHLEYGDTYEGAAKREIKEELGISPKLKFVRKDLIESPEEIEYSAIFSASVDEQPMEFDKDEIDEVRWVPIRELRRLIDKEEISDGAKSVMKIMGYIESDL